MDVESGRMFRPTAPFVSTHEFRWRSDGPVPSEVEFLLAASHVGAEVTVPGLAGQMAIVKECSLVAEFKGTTKAKFDLAWIFR